ncbi:hypothetical protein P154DRAFT_517371 [Amniculicola lignicola CBS 123094]|uniref:CFEM domain-containing protein n=1 Tax=Amniculicola lignicola CBS 123094 TaxID=1392246 RepID=A0A6A5X0L3_9PLEO|nr:hypothetical protein P154DRAFT_517371 [Amniculicola lignicola CBS 123094]
MKFSISAIVLAASLSFVGAQDLTGIPSCSLTCFAAAVSASGCSLTNTECQCTTGRETITNSITACVPSKCSAEDIAKIAPAVQKLCAAAGVTVSNLPTAVGSATGSAASRTSTPTGTAAGAAASSSSTGAAAPTHMAAAGAIALGFVAMLGL